MKRHSREDAMAAIFCQLLGMLATLGLQLYGGTSLICSMEKMDDDWKPKLQSSIEDWSLNFYDSFMPFNFTIKAELQVEVKYEVPILNPTVNATNANAKASDISESEFKVYESRTETQNRTFAGSKIQIEPLKDDFKVFQVTEEYPVVVRTPQINQFNSNTVAWI
jgi:hypothetical protein